MPKLSAKTGRRFHVAFMLFWVGNLIAANIVLDMEPAVRYLVNISIYANIVGHWSGWSAERPTEIEE